MTVDSIRNSCDVFYHTTAPSGSKLIFFDVDWKILSFFAFWVPNGLSFDVKVMFNNGLGVYLYNWITFFSMFFANRFFLFWPYFGIVLGFWGPAHLGLHLFWILLNISSIIQMWLWERSAWRLTSRIIWQMYKILCQVPLL